MKPNRGCSKKNWINPIFDPQKVEELKEIREKNLEDLTDGFWLPDERMADFLTNEYVKLHPNLSIDPVVVNEFFALIEAIEEKRDEYCAEEISQVLELGEKAVQYLLKIVGLEVMHSNNTFKHAITWGIKNSKPLTAIAKRTPWTYQNISFYLSQRPSLKKLWELSRNQKKEEKRIKAKQKRESRQNLLELMKLKAEQKAQDNFPLAKALEYLRKTIAPKYTLTTLIGVFDRSQKKEVLTLREIGEPLGIDGRGVLRIFKRVNLKHRGRKFEMLSEEEIKALKRGVRYGLSNDNIAYFLRVKPTTTVTAYAHLLDKKRARRKNNLECVTYTKNHTFIRAGHQKISMALEALEAGFEDKDVCTYAKVTPLACKKIKSHKEELTDKIVRGLIEIYNNPDITKPYPSEQCVFGNHSTTK